MTHLKIRLMPLSGVRGAKLPSRVEGTLLPKVRRDTILPPGQARQNKSSRRVEELLSWMFY